jgi:glucose-1-phosphate adenylyltransferase
VAEKREKISIIRSYLAIILEETLPSLENILAVILGGGAGTRLYPLTQQRSKPAVPIAGKYRLIDVPISNCINSGIYRIAILTQFNSVSLNRHITRTYDFDTFHQGWVEILAAEQTPTSVEWYAGTADAVRKQLAEIKISRADYILVLAGDHLYRMDYEKLARFHWERHADITVAVQPVTAGNASRYGVLKCNSDHRINSFIEKCSDPALLEHFVSRDSQEKPYLASMGIYLFNAAVLFEILENTAYEDFGSQIIPAVLDTHRVYGFDFDGFWEDIGTIRSFYETNLMLAQPGSPFNFYDPVRPIYTHARFLPGSVVDGATLNNVLLAEGCQIHQAVINDSIVGLRSQIARGVVMKKSIMMGADYYDPPGNTLSGAIPLGIGANCYIEGAILDKNTCIGEGVIILPFPRGVDLDEDNWVVRDGIVIIPKSAVLLPNTHIEPQEILK